MRRKPYHNAAVQPAAPLGVRFLRAIVPRLPRGRYALLSSGLARRGRFIARLAPELGAAKFACDLSEDVAREACLTGFYEPPVTRVFERYAVPGATVIDAGANWGYFSLIAAGRVGSGGSVISLEPDPRQIAALEANVALNGYRHVRVIRAAAAAAPGRVTLAGYRDDAGNRGVSRIGAAGGDAPSFDVEAITIDDLTRGSTVDLIKIDVEGAEDLVLAGMRDGLAARRYRAILLELHPSLLADRGVDPASIVAGLAGFGYRGHTIDLSPSAYRAAATSQVDLDRLLQPESAWRGSEWPHMLWLC